jgi:hypothetical protein
MSEVDRYPLMVRLLEQDEGGGYLCEFPDLPGCMGDGATPEEAIADGKEARSVSRSSREGATDGVGDQVVDRFGLDVERRDRRRDRRRQGRMRTTP